MNLCGNSIFRLAAILIGAAFVFGASLISERAQADTSACLSAGGEAAVTACRRDLHSDPDNVTVRLALTDALMALKRYGEAVTVLRQGVDRLPGNEALKKKLTLAQSYREEQQWIEKRQKRKGSVSRFKNSDTRIRLSLIRCTILKGEAAMTACNQGLSLDPHNSDLLTGRGNVWLDKDQIVNAMVDFRAALAADPQNRDAADSLRLAQAKRKIKVTECMQLDGREGLGACDAALQRGASDEFVIQKRRAELLHAMDREKEALAAYRIAARLHPQDEQVRQALAALTPPAEKTATSQPAGPVAAIAGPSRSATAKTPPKPVRIRPAAKPNPPIETAGIGHEPPASASAKKEGLASSEKKTAAAAGATSPPPSIDVGQARRYSNAPEMPGVTH
jgi:tetratricopeptide (TPR) repeat protein